MVIDASLARGIRREFLRALAEEWKAYGRRESADALRNGYLSSPTTKSFRRAVARARARLGSLLPVSEAAVEAKSRCGWVALSLVPNLDPAGAAEGVKVRALMLRKAHSPLEGTLRATFAAHAIDRVIQRARLVDLPPKFSDLEAISAEFADAVHFISPALHVLAKLSGDRAAGLHLLLPAAHGFFLGCFDQDGGGVLIKTYVDSGKMRDYEREALRQLLRIPTATLALCSMGQLAPGWMTTEIDRIGEQLHQVWRDFGWRLAEHQSPKGLSDRAWASRDSVPSPDFRATAAVP